MIARHSPYQWRLGDEGPFSHRCHGTPEEPRWLKRCLPLAVASAWHRLPQTMSARDNAMHVNNRGLPLSTASAKAAAAFDHLDPVPKIDLRSTSARTARLAPALYPAALFLSALLLFAVQP